MGHAIFIVMHLGLLMFAPLGLLLSIPLHLIYSAAGSRGRVPPTERVSRRTHVRCPDCKELVRKDARKCRHCGTPLVPSD